MSINQEGVGETTPGFLDTWSELLSDPECSESLGKLLSDPNLTRRWQRVWELGPDLQVKKRMLSGSGVYEIWPTGRIDGAIDTEAGPIPFEGGTICDPERVDIQSGPLNRWRTAVEEAESAIRFAYDRMRPREALRTIGQIWTQLDRTGELAAARSRILAGRLGRLPLAEAPSWFTARKEALAEQRDDDGSASVDMLALESSDLLVRACMAAIDGPAKPEAEVEAGPFGRVIIDWYIPQGRFQWMVEACHSPWPLTKAYELTQEEGDSFGSPAQTRVLHNAFDAVESFVQFFGRR
jgi:hypothetical protein